MLKAAQHALELVQDGCVIGLGSGRAATSFVQALGARVAAGLTVRGVPTSRSTAEFASRLGIPLASLDDVETVDLTVDGADEVDPDLNLIKGRGGALVREKIVAACSKKVIILVGVEKRVTTLGAHGILPIEVVPFGLMFCKHRLKDLGYPSQVREQDGQRFVTDNGNHILDCSIRPVSDPAELDRVLLSIPGVVGTGLFLGLADAVYIEDGDTLRVAKRIS